MLIALSCIVPHLNNATNPELSFIDYNKCHQLFETTIYKREIVFKNKTLQLATGEDHKWGFGEFLSGK